MLNEGDARGWLHLFADEILKKEPPSTGALAEQYQGGVFVSVETGGGPPKQNP